MQIYVVGPHGAGKTTLAKAISERYGLVYMPEFARELLNEMAKDWRRMSPVEYLQFESALTIWFSSLKEETGFVSDRSVIDIAAYIWRYIVKHDTLSDPKFGKMWEKLYKQASNPDCIDRRPDTIYIFAKHTENDEQVFIKNFIEKALLRGGIQEYKNYLSPPFYLSYYRPTEESSIYSMEYFIDSILPKAIGTVAKERRNGSERLW